MGPRVAAVHTLQFATRQQLQQLWQAALQLVQGGSVCTGRKSGVNSCMVGMSETIAPSSCSTS